MGKRIYNVNQHFFSEINSEEKAYILGLMYSDGCIFTSNGSYYIRFGQAEDRKDIVEKVNQVLESTYPIRSSMNGSKLFYEVQYTSKEMFDDLEKLGVTQRKSLTCTFPNYISNNLLCHFIRGLFDGDGCVWNGKRKIMKVKDTSKECGYREKIVHNVKFTYTGNFLFVSELQNILCNILGFSKTKLNFSKAKETKHICTMEYSGRKQMTKFYNYLYNNATIFSEQKKLKFEEIICAALEKSNVETALIEETAEMPIVNQASQLL